MSLEMTIPRAEIRQIAGVILSGNPDDAEFMRAHVIDYMRSERDSMRASRRLKGVHSATSDDELRQLQNLRKRAGKAIDGTSDSFQGGAELVRGRVGVLAGRLGSRAPWWLSSILRVRPEKSHPLISPIQSRTEELRNDRERLKEIIIGSDIALRESQVRTKAAAEEFLSFCDGVAAHSPKEVAKAYLKIRPERISSVAELFAQNHGLEEEYLRFLPDCIRHYQKFNNYTRWFKNAFGVLWSQYRADDPSQLGTEAKKLWLEYLTKNLLIPHWL